MQCVPACPQLFIPLTFGPVQPAQLTRRPPARLRALSTAGGSSAYTVRGRSVPVLCHGCVPPSSDATGSEAMLAVDRPSPGACPDSTHAVQASKGRPSMISLLLQKGAAVNARDELGATPLHRCGATPHVLLVLATQTGGTARCPIRRLTPRLTGQGLRQGLQRRQDGRRARAGGAGARPAGHQGQAGGPPAAVLTAGCPTCGSAHSIWRGEQVSHLRLCS